MLPVCSCMLSLLSLLSLYCPDSGFVRECFILCDAVIVPSKGHRERQRLEWQACSVLGRATLLALGT